MTSKKSQGGQNIEQGIKTGGIQSKGSVNISQNASMQGAISESMSSAEFVTALSLLIEQLHKYESLDPDIKEAQKELEAAAAEANKQQPNGSIIRRFMGKAKGMLESISDVASPIVPLLTTIGELAKKAPEIFKIFAP